MDELIKYALQGRLVPFIGAGASMIPPTSLPSWWQVNRAIISAIADEAQTIVGDTTGLAELVFKRQEAYKFPPEYAAEIIAATAGEEYFAVLQCLDSNVPNGVHFALAEMARRGQTRAIITTNFDQAIEEAFNRLKIPVEVRYTTEDMVELSNKLDQLNSKDCPCQLIKLHGSAQQSDTLIDTLSQRKRGFPEPTINCIRYLLKWGYWLFLGYSGADLEAEPNYLFLRGDSRSAMGFTWLVQEGKQPLEAVKSLVKLYDDRANICFGLLPDWLRLILPDTAILKAQVNDATTPHQRDVRKHTKDWATQIGAKRCGLLLSSLLDVAGESPSAMGIAKSVFACLPMSQTRVSVDESEKSICAIAQPNHNEAGQVDVPVMLTTGEAQPIIVAVAGPHIAGNDAELELYYEVCKFLHHLHYQRGDQQNARDMAYRALIASGQSGNVRIAAECLGMLANLRTAEGDLVGAERMYDFALAAAQTDPLVLPSLLTNRARIQAMRNGPNDSRQSLRDALDIYSKIGDAIGRASTLVGLGNVAHDLKELEEADRLYTEAESIFNRLGNEAARGRLHLNRGKAAREQGDLDLSQCHYEQARDIFDHIDDRRGNVEALHGIAITYDLLKLHDVAEKLYLLAARKSEELDYLNESASIWNNLARLYRDLRSFEEMDAARKRAASAYEQSGNLQGVANTHFARGCDFVERHEPDKATGCFRLSLQIFNDLGNELRSLEALANLAKSLYDSGAYKDALNHYRTLTEHHKSSSSRQIYLMALVGQAKCYARQSNLPEANRYLVEAFAHDLSISGPQNATNMAIGLSEQWLNEFQDLAFVLHFLRNVISTIESKDANVETLPLKTQITRLEARMDGITDRPDVLYQKGMQTYRESKPEESVALFKQALTLYEQLGQTSKCAMTVNSIGIVLRSMGETQVATEQFRKSISLYESIDQLRESILPLVNLAQTYVEMGSNDLGIKKYTEIIERLESLGDYNSAALARLDTARCMMDEVNEKFIPMAEARYIAQKAKELIEPVFPRLLEAPPPHSVSAKRIMALCEQIINYIV